MTRRLGRAPLVAAAALSMTWGIWLGLLRLGWILPLPWPDQLILHGPLMIGGFLGTFIGLERAVGLAKPWAYAAPVSSALGALLLVFGPPGPAGPLLVTAASGIVVAVFVVIVRREPSLFAFTMLVGAACWLAGNALWVGGAAIYRVVPWWLAFLVLTIAGERLELNRLLQPTPRVGAAFAAAAAIVVAGTIGSWVRPAEGARAIGVGLLGLAWWLSQHDMARRTIRRPGPTRYIAMCLLLGYAWLAVAGILLIATGAMAPGMTYDATLHAVFLGFVVSMIFGHAPIVLPAVLGRPLIFQRSFYAHLVLLHASVAIRLTGDLVETLARIRSWGGLLNALAILWFVGSTAWAARPAGSPRRAPAQPY